MIGWSAEIALALMTGFRGQPGDMASRTPVHLGKNLLCYGDNLNVLRNRIPSAWVDLIYLDPPFNSDRSYNVLFRHRSGAEAQAQIEACSRLRWVVRSSRAVMGLAGPPPRPLARSR
jgi:tRNA1(Val) A37 N6-methylase TrmN6